MATKEVVVKLTGDSSNLKKSIDEITNQFSGMSKNFLNVGKKAGIAFAGLSGFLTLAGGSALKSAGQFEKFESTLKVMLGTTELAKQRMKELEDFAWKTPFELTDVVQLGNQLQTIGKYSQENMTILGDLAAASGKPLSQVTGAYQKLASGQKGVAADMFRDMLISTKDWVKATGKSMKDLSTEEMMAALPDIMENKKFSGMMEETASTFEALGAGISDVIGLTLKDIGGVFLPTAKEIQKEIIKILNGVRDFVKEHPGIVKFAVAFLGITTAVLGMVSAIGFVGSAVLNGIMVVKKLVTVIKLVNIAMKAAFLTNPIFLTIAAIAALIAISYVLVKNLDRVKKFFVGLFDYIKKNSKEVAVMFAKAMVSPITLIIEKRNAIGNFFKNIGKAAKESIPGGVADSESGGKTGAGGNVDSDTGMPSLWTEEKANEDAVSYMNALLSAIQNGGDILMAIGMEMATQIAESFVTNLFSPVFIGLQTLAMSLSGLLTTAFAPLLSPVNAFVGKMLSIFALGVNSIGNLFKSTGIGQAVMQFLSAILDPIKLFQIAMLTAAKLGAISWALIMAIPTSGASLAEIPIAIAELASGIAAVTAVGLAAGSSGLDEDMVAQFSKGEIVVPETFSEGIKSGELALTSAGGGNSAPPVNVSLDGANFNGTFDSDMAMGIGQQIALAIKNNVMAPLPS